MDKNMFFQLSKQLKPDQSLLLMADYTVKLVWHDNNDKKHYKYIGKVEEFSNEIAPTINKPWATPPLKGKQSFHKFGQILPKYDRQNEEKSKKIQKWTMAFNALKSLDFTPKKSIWTDTYLKVNYEIEEINGIKVYYFQGTPRYIEFENEKLIIPQLKPELKTEIIEE